MFVKMFLKNSTTLEKLRRDIIGLQQVLDIYSKFRTKMYKKANCKIAMYAINSMYKHILIF